MTKFFLSLIIICITVNCYAQPDKQYRFSAGGETGYATGNYNATHKLGFGLAVQGEYSFSEAASLTASVGYFTFATKTQYDTVPSGIYARPQPASTGIPVLVGLKFNISDKFYGLPEAGVAFVSSNGIAATYTLAVGMQTSRHVDFSIRYQSVIKVNARGSFIMARAAYVF